MEDTPKPLWCKIDADGMRLAAFDRSELENWVKNQQKGELPIYNEGEYFATLRAESIRQGLFSGTSPNPPSQGQ